MKISNSFKKICLVALLFSFLWTALPAYAAPATADNQAQNAALDKSLQKNPIIRDIQDIVDFLSAGVGLVVVAMIILGGIQYSIAGDNSQKITDAKKRIANALIALLVFIFLFAFVQWLIPGGVFS
jgi:uncharacterized protein YqhQ